MFRSLIHYRHLNAAVLFGVAVAAAVLTGALMVGDSVRASLRAMTFDRLGNIDYAIVTEGFVPEDLETRLREATTEIEISGTVFLQGSANFQSRRATGVQVLGVTESFDALFDGDTGFADLLASEQGQPFPSAILNKPLADELGISVGDDLVVNFESISDINRDSVYGEKERDAIVERARLRVRAVIPATGPGRFALSPSQNLPKTVMMPRSVLQRALDRRDGINVLLAGRPDSNGGYGDSLATAVGERVTLADLGLEQRVTEGYFSLETPNFFLRESVVATARAVAASQNLAFLETSSYLSNNLSFDDRSMPYSLITALELGGPLVPDQPTTGSTDLGLNEVVLSQWAVDDLGVTPGDTLELTYYTVGAREELVEETVRLTLKGVLPMSGIAVDREITPEFPGIEDADNIGDWEPPFPMEMGRIRDKDEAFWDDYRTSSKIFISPETGRALWDSRFGFVTTMRFAAKDDTATADAAELFTRAFLAEIDPTEAGLGFTGLKEEGLAASSGATDFTGLFISLSFFIIGSALLLVGMFFRLSVAQRASEIGILAAAGYTARRIGRRFLGEGLVLCGTGSLLGALAGAGYAMGVMWALRNWWYLGSSQLYFTLEPITLAIGFGISLVVALATIYTTVRQAGKRSVTTLIAGRVDSGKLRTGKRSRLIMWIFLVLAVAMSAAAVTLPPTGLFFGVGTCLLVAGLAFVSSRFSDRHIENGISGIFSMASRNMGRQAGRSLVSISLIAFACYTIVAVGLYRNAGEVDPDEKGSGAGGFFLEAETEVPVHANLSDEDDRADIGMDIDLDKMLAETHIVQLRLRGGDDASCLNLFAPREPRLLGVPDATTFEGRFSFAATAEARENPWSLLEEPLEDGAIPVFGDQNSMMWILKLQMGGDLVMEAENGDPVTLRLMGMLQKGSIFQSELLMSEANFLRLFPSQSGYRYFLFENRQDNRSELAGSFEADFSDFGADAVSTAAKIEVFHEIENTYISIFQMLGGLGLLLGTLGMGAVIYRNALERKGEFAAMRAFGFRGNAISRLLIAENTVLLSAGMLIGTLSALIAMAPNLVASHQFPPVNAIALTLSGVFAVGLTASLWAVGRARRFPLLEALRGR